MTELYESIERLRREYRDESVLTMTVHAPPTVVHLQADGSLLVAEEPAAAVGMSLSGSMVRLLGHPEGYGLRFAVRRGLHAWERYCRGRHTRWPDHRSQPACSQLAWAVIRDNFSVFFMADELGLSFPRAERMLIMACEYIDKQRERWEAQAVA